MRLLIISNTSWSLVNFRLQLARYLRDQKGCEVILSGPSDGYEETILQAGFEWRELQLDGQSLNPVAELFSLCNLWGLVKKIKPDSMLLFTSKPNIYGGLVARVTGVPAVHNIAGLGRAFSSQKRLLRPLIELGYRLALRGSSVVFFQNDSDRKTLLFSGAVHPNQARRLFGSGVDLNSYHPRFRQQKVGNPRFSFLLSARLLRAKGVEVYAQAAKIVGGSLPHTEFNIIGPIVEGDSDAFTLEDIRVLEKECGVRYLGRTDVVRDFLATADCIVLPSFYGEGVPRSLLEAAAMGLPIITTLSPGCQDAVEDQVSGWLVTPRDIDSLATAMFSAATLAAPQLAKMSDASRLRAEALFSESEVFNAYESALATYNEKKQGWRIKRSRG